MPTRKQSISKILGGFQVIRRAMLRQMAEQQANDQDENTVTLAQQMTLLTVAARGAVSVKEIAKARMISSSAATQVVDSLVKKGFLIRSQDEQDRRASVVALGPAYQKIADAHAGNAATYLTPIFSSLSKQELEEYERLNTKLVNALQESQLT